MKDNLQFKFSAYRAIGTLGLSGLIMAAIVMGGGYGFVNIPAGLFTFGISFFLLLISFGPDFIAFIPASLLCLFCSPVRPNQRFAEIAKYGSRYVIGGGTIGALIGMIQMLSSLSDPSSIGMGLAVALVMPFYAILASEIYFAVAYKTFSDSGHSIPCPLSMRNVAIPLIVIGAMMGTFFLMLIAFGNMREEALIRENYIHDEYIEEQHNQALDPTSG